MAVGVTVAESVAVPGAGVVGTFVDVAVLDAVAGGITEAVEVGGGVAVGVAVDGLDGVGVGLAVGVAVAVAPPTVGVALGAAVGLRAPVAEADGVAVGGIGDAV